MLRKAIVARIFGGEVFDREQVIANYKRHNDEVKRTIRPERLLTYEVSQGWEPLCRFLGVSTPNEPFPKVNSTDEYKVRIATVFNRDAQRLPQRIRLPARFAISCETRIKPLKLPDSVGNSLHATHFVRRL